MKATIDKYKQEELDECLKYGKMYMKIGKDLTIYNPTDRLREGVYRDFTFPNPDYAKKVRMGLWTGNTPKTIEMFKNVHGTIVMPAGCYYSVSEYMFVDDVMRMPIIDESSCPAVDWSKSDRVPLYPFQGLPVRRMINFRVGILNSPAGSGKTQMGLAMAQRIGTRVLWLTHTHDLLEQSYNRACQYFPKKWLGKISNGKVNIGSHITFATVQTMSKLDLDSMCDEWGMIIVDECHRCVGTPASITMFSNVLNHLYARYRYGLSATVHRADGLIACTTALLGKVITTVPKSDLSDNLCPIEVHPLQTGTRITEDALNFDGTLNYSRMITNLCDNEERIDFLVKHLKEQLKQGHSILVLAERVPYLRRLADHFKEKDVAVISGKTPHNTRDQMLEDMRQGKRKILFASYSLAKEGLDIPRLDTLFLATPQKDYTVIIQSVGRIGRAFEGKEKAICYDLIDDGAYFFKSWKKRIKHYTRGGYYIIE